MLANGSQITNFNDNLISAQKIRVEHLYSIYLDAMKLAFDEGNCYVEYAMKKRNIDLEAALEVRSNHIKNAATKYQEYNIKSLAQTFKVSVSEIRLATNRIVSQ